MRERSKRAVLYLRVSTEEQVDNYSLKTQDEICRKEAQRRGYVIEKIFREEGRSAKTIDGRPKLISLLEYCRRNKSKIEALIVYRLDRLSRETGDYLAIRKKLNTYGILLISTAEPTGTSPTEKLIETILAGFAQLENDIRAERSRNGMHTRFMSGLPNGKPPPGYLMVNGYVVKDSNIFDQVKKAWDIMATGTKTAGEMAEILNSFRLKSGRTGKIYRFNKKDIYRFFRNKFYMGILTSETYKKEVRGQHVPMITQAQFIKVQNIFDKKNPAKLNLVLRNRNNEDFPLRRFIKCKKCKLSFTGSWSTGRGGKYAYYHCLSRCKSSNLPRKIIHSAFNQLLKARSLSQEYITLYTTIFEKVYEMRFVKIRLKQINTTSQIRRLKEIKNSLIQKNLTGVYSDIDFKEQLDLIENQLENMSIISKQTVLDQYTKDSAKTYLLHFMNDIVKAYERCDIKQKRALISLLFPKGLLWNYPGLTSR